MTDAFRGRARGRATRRLRVLARAGAVFITIALLSVSLTAVTSAAEPPLHPSAVLRGVVNGTGTAQAGYTVSLYASYVKGPPRWELLGIDTTNRTGHFQIDYKLAPADPHHDKAVLYVLAEKSESMLASAIGDVSENDSVVVNERTTVAIGTAFAQFIHGRSITGNTYGMLNAVHMAANMADPRTGSIGAVLDNPPNGARTSTRATFNSLANMVASCVAAQSHCGTLFEEATPPGGPPPSTVLQALADITKDPSNNVGDLFGLAEANTTYSPALAKAPTSWLLFIKFTGGFYSRYSSSNLMSGPGNITFDKRGDAWVNDNYVPTARLTVACAGLRLLKFYPWGQPYPGSPYFGGGLSGAGFGIALDARGLVWDANFGFEAPACANGTVPPNPAKKIPATHDSVSLFLPNGVPLSGPQGLTNGDIWWPQGTASDTKGDVWFANCGNDTVTLYPGGNPAKARNIPLPGGQGATGNYRVTLPDQPRIKPFAVAIDPEGRAWVTGDKADEVYIVSRDGRVQTVPTHGLLKWPMGIASDAAGNMWVSSSGSVDVPCVTPLDTSNHELASLVLFPADGSAPTQYTGGGLTIPWGDAVDGNGTVWVFNFGTRPSAGTSSLAETGVSHFCGADASTCPVDPGNCPNQVTTGCPISPSTGYTSDALDRVTGGGIDPSGNLWLMNNWKKAGPTQPVYNTNPGGNSIVIVPGAATPVQTPLIGPPEPFGTRPASH